MLVFLRTFYLFLLIFAGFFLASPQVHAVNDLYADCIKSYDFSNDEYAEVVLYPLDRNCDERCNRECASLSRKTSNGAELNDAVISACENFCRNGSAHPGEYFSGQYYEEVRRDGKLQVVARGPITIPYICNLTPGTEDELLTSKSLPNNYQLVEYNDPLQNGDYIDLRFTGGNQQLYMCGKRIVEYKPIISETDPKVWDDKTKKVPPELKDTHMCMSYMSNPSYYDLWHYFNSTNFAGPEYDSCRWHARNHKYIRTGIYPAYGDDLTVYFNGDYGYTEVNIGSNREPRFVPTSQFNLLSCMQNEGLSSDVRSFCQDLIYPSSAIHFYIADDLGDELYTSNFTALYGESARDGAFNLAELQKKACAANILQNRTTTSEKTEDLYLTGMKATLLETPDFAINRNNRTCSADPTYACNNVDSCYQLIGLGEKKYLFSGRLSEDNNNITVSNNPDFRKRNQLYLRHFQSDFDDKNAVAKYSKHVGGYNVKVEWGGCPINDGSNVQYAVLRSGKDGNYDYSELTDDSIWEDVPEGAFFGGKSFKIDAKPLSPGIRYGLIFRIKPLRVPESASAAIADLYENPANHYGRYTFTARKITPRTYEDGGFIRDIVLLARDGILGRQGDDGQYINGATQIIYNGVVQKYNFINIVRALLIFYVILTSIFFVMGLINVNQKELVIRLLKVGLVVAIISPGSWEFLYDNFLNAFINGTFELIALLLGSAYPDASLGLEEDPTRVFGIFEYVLSLMFNDKTWLKIFALCLSGGGVGIALALGFIISVGIYIVCIAKATVMFIFSFLGISLMILLAPIFIPLMLFKMTENFFQYWWKLILSFAMQPLMIFGTITIFNMVILALVRSCLNFTICPYCLLYIGFLDWFGWDACLIQGWKIATNMHMPVSVSSTFLPLNIVGAILALLLLTHAMWIFTTFITTVASRLFTQMAVREATLAKPGDSVQGAIGGTADTLANIAKSFGSDDKDKDEDDKGPRDEDDKDKKDEEDDENNDGDEDNDDNDRDESEESRYGDEPDESSDSDRSNDDRFEELPNTSSDESNN